MATTASGVSLRRRRAAVRRGGKLGQRSHLAATDPVPSGRAARRPAHHARVRERPPRDGRAGSGQCREARRARLPVKENGPVSLPPTETLYGEVIEAVKKLRPLWNHMASHGSWMMPRALFLLARSQARLGQVDAARHGLDALLAQWARADADVPLVAAARALRASLGPQKNPQ